MRNRHRHSRRDQGPSLIVTLVKYLLLFVILAGAGGVTWLALTPMDAPSHQVVREVPRDRLNPA